MFLCMLIWGFSMSIWGYRLLDVKMTQWSVGHGGFHTTEIRKSFRTAGTTRHYIYDCGSTAWVGLLHPRIESYVKGLRASYTQHIDTLYLSHFDYDHVNGLEKLSEELAPEIQIVKIVIPFLTPEQQLATIASQNLEYSTLYVDLVLSPTETLGELFPGAEVEILAPSEANELSGEVDFPSNSPGSMGIRSDSAEPGSSGVLWEVIAYAQPDVPAKAQEFWKKVQDRGLAPGKNLDTATIRVLLKNHRAALRRLANEVLGADGSNSSSIVLYSAPARGFEVKCFIRRNDRKVPWDQLPANARHWWTRNSKKFGGWLSTGDARLETNSGVSRLVRGLGVQRPERVTVIAAPHHGSKNNSSTHLWQAFPNATCVTVHATGKSSHHPSPQVVKEVEKQQRTWFVVAEHSSDISMYCRVYPVSGV